MSYQIVLAAWWSVPKPISILPLAGKPSASRWLSVAPQNHLESPLDVRAILAATSRAGSNQRLAIAVGANIGLHNGTFNEPLPGRAPATEVRVSIRLVKGRKLACSRA